MTNVNRLKNRLTHCDDLDLLMRHAQSGSYSENVEKQITGLNLCKKGLGNDFLAELEGLSHLEALNLSDNDFTELVLPENLTALRYLDLSDCKDLKRLVLPARASQLERIDVSDCALETLVLPENMPGLLYLDASRNQLKQLNFGKNAPCVEHLDLSGNEIKELELPHFFHSIRRLYLGNCQLAGVPDEHYKEYKESSQALKAYFLARDQSGEVLNNEAKLIFFGNGRAGKTTLSKQLREGVFDPSIEMTHGILLEEWVIEASEFPPALVEKINAEIASARAKGVHLNPPPSVILNTWDFGGQEYFHATHRLFLNSNVLYLLVWETETNRQQEDCGDFPDAYWVSNIKHYAPKHTLLTVQNKAKDSVAYDRRQLQYKINYRDASNNRAVEQYQLDAIDLREAVLAQLADLHHIGEKIPKIHDEIRQKIKERKAIDPFLRFEDFEKFCFDLDYTPSQLMQQEGQMRSITNFLHDTGSIICYRFKADRVENRLDDYVFIDPKWVTQTIYQILDKSTLENKGEFDRQHIETVLRLKQNVLQETDLWIDLMQEFELIFLREKEGKEIFIAPQYLPTDCKDLSIKAMNNLLEELPYQLVLYYPDFLPRSVIGRFICRHGNLAKEEYWKYGIVLHRNGSKALAVCNYDQKEITIRYAADYAELALEAFNTLLKIDKPETLEISLSKDGNPGVLVGPVQFKKLLQRINTRKTYIEWNDLEFDLAPFERLFRWEKSGLFIEGSDGERGPRFDQKTPTIQHPNDIMEEIISATVRNFTPFSQVKEKIRLLYLAAAPSHLGPINTGRDSRFKDLIKYFDEEKRFEVPTEQQGITREQFQHFVLSNKPHILHYSGHGNLEGIFLEDGQIKASVLAGILKLVPNTQCVLLSACKSLPAAQEVAKIVPYAIGTRRNVNDNAAIEFARGFYQALVSEYTVEDAFEAGKLAVDIKGLPDADVWVLVKGIRDPQVPPAPKPAPAIPPPPTSAPVPKKAFISAVPADKAALEHFKTQLSTYRRNGTLTHWDEGDLVPGTERLPAIQKAFDEADAIFFLVSADFLNQDDKWQKEIPEALARHRAGTAVVVPILVRPCGWENTALHALSPLPADKKAISTAAKPDEAWNDVITAIGRILA